MIDKKKAEIQVKRDIKIEDVSAANLPERFTIKDPGILMKEMRSSFLRKARESKKISIEEAAKKLDVSVDTLEKMELGHVSEQDMMTLHEMSEFYGIDYFKMLRLFKLVENKPYHEYGIAACHDRKIDDETQAELIEFMNSLKEA